MSTLEQSFTCLDLLPVRWVNSEGQPQTECAILGQVWPTGGVVQLDQPVPLGTTMVISLPDADVKAKVQACGSDEFGSYVELFVNLADGWLGSRFQPAFQMETRFSQEPHTSGVDYSMALSQAA